MRQKLLFITINLPRALKPKHSLKFRRRQNIQTVLEDSLVSYQRFHVLYQKW